MSRGEYFNKDRYCVEVVSSNAGQSSKYYCLLFVDEYLLSSSFKGIVWEIYECVSEVFSHLGRMSGMIFRVHCRQGSRVPQGACKGVAGRSSIPCKDPDTLWSNTFVHFFGEFWPHQTLKIIPNILPSCDKTSEMHSYISQTIPLIMVFDGSHEQPIELVIKEEQPEDLSIVSGSNITQPNFLNFHLI